MAQCPRPSNTIPLPVRLCFSNGISAMGGGTILIEGMDLLPFGVVSALLIGSCAGLAVVLHREERAGATAGTAGALAFILLCFHLMGFADLADDGQRLEGTTAIAVFVLLALRFAFWFAARTLRSDTARRVGKLPWVEGAYYTGMIVGLTLFAKLMPGFQWALAFDAAFCLIAGFVDWSGKFMAPHGAGTGEECTMRMVSKRAGVSVFSLTAVVCVSVIFFLALADVRSSQWSGILALSLLLIAATTYEVLALVFLESVGGDDEKKTEERRYFVAKSLCVMGIFGALALWLLGQLPKSAWIACSMICMVIVWAVLIQRHAETAVHRSANIAAVTTGEGDRRRRWGLKTTVLVALTIMAQIVPFTLATVVAAQDGRCATIGSEWILAVFYAGAALGATWVGLRKPVLRNRHGGAATKVGTRIVVDRTDRADATVR